ncbi:MAG: hypothetical protein AAFQ87_24390, partial [Bacteroidota bacterium]
PYWRGSLMCLLGKKQRLSMHLSWLQSGWVDGDVRYTNADSPYTEEGRIERRLRSLQGGIGIMLGGS